MKRIKRNNRGFTMAELLIVVAIIAVLSGVGFIAVQNYSRGMAQLERDSIAKEIFVAAQNHLTQANSQGYLGVTDFGTPANSDVDQAEGAANIYYYAVNDSFNWESTSAIDQMLPFGSIDETVRAGGTYIIRYQPNPATVLDVFYCPPAGQYPLKLDAEEYDTLMKTCKGDEKRNARRDYHGAVIGWYGGAESLETGAEINAPDIRVENGDRLTVTVYNTNQATMGPPEAGNEEVSLKLIIKGVDSGAMMAIPMFYVSDIKRYSTPTQRYALNGEYLDAAQEGANPVLEYTVVLDDITAKDMRFAALNGLSQYMNNVQFIPGEDIVVSAVAYSNKKLTNIAYSREYTTNSLFADKVPVEGSTESTDPNVGTPSVATVASIRHLENLDTAVSQFAKDAAAQNKLNIQKVEQTQDLDWSAFKTAIAPNPEDAESVRILYNDGDMTEAGCYKPVDIGYALTYDGMTTLTEAPAEGGEGAPAVTTEVIHEIKNIRVNTDADAGVFGSVSAIGTIKNLKIVDCDIASTGEGSSAGALAGELNGVDVLNVTAYGKSTFKNAEGKDVTRNVTAAGSAGGLIGSMNGGSVDNCAAALYVSGGKDAGGLVGAISGTGAQVKASYSGGHTDHGCYYVVEEKGGAVSLKLEDGKPVPIVNVTGADNVGGLIGSAGDATVEKCYSTCSVKGQTAGGLAGTAGGEIRNCYCTGLVVGATAPADDDGEGGDGEGGDGDEGGEGGEGGEGADGDAGKGTCGAFAGKLNSATVTNCLYYGIINDGLPALGEGTAVGISELDADAASYNAFVGAPNAWNAAQPYDATLETYYKDATAEPTSRFNLKTVDQLDPAVTVKKKSDAVHYGDWPAPEIFVTNTKAA